MNINRPLDSGSIRIVMAASLILFANILVIGAQNAPFKVSRNVDSVPLGEQARTVPTSNGQIKIKINLDTGQSVQATQFEGGLIRMEIEGVGVFGFTPYRRGQDTEETISVKVFRITAINKNGKVVGEGITELERVDLVGDQPIRALGALVNAEMRFTLQLVGVKDAAKIKEISLRPVFEGSCCVTCDGVRTCACAVEALCGSCCMGDCCGAPGPN